MFTGANRTPRNLHRGNPSHTPARRRPAVEALEERWLMSVPPPPTGLVGMGISTSAISLHWQPSPDHSVTGYDVVYHYWKSVTGGGKGSHGGGHYVDSTIAAGVTADAFTVSGLLSGKAYSYFVEAVNPSGLSLPSALVNVETWVAPSLPYSSEFFLSNGAVYSSPAPATAGLTTQITFPAGGNPLTFSIQNGPSTATIDARTGVLSFTPTAKEVGSVTITLKASNPLGSVTLPVTFDVTAQNPALLKPKLKLSTTPLVYNGSYLSPAVSVVGTDGVTPISGSLAFAYDGSYLKNVGTYHVLVTFTSGNPSYANATLLGTVTVAKATPAFNYLASPTIAQGDATATLSGNILASYLAIPTGDVVAITVANTTYYAPIDANGNFSLSIDPSALSVGAHTITYAFAGDANFKAAVTATGKLTVLPVAAPVITLQPKNVVTTAGDGAVFTANASGSPVPSVQWQLSTDNGATWTNVYNLYGTTLALSYTSAGENGYLYRAVFTNRIGSVISQPAKLTVEVDTGGGN